MVAAILIFYFCLKEFALLVETFQALSENKYDFFFVCMFTRLFKFLGYNVRKSSPKAAKYQYVVKLNITTFCFYNSRRIVYSFTGTSKILNI